MQTRRLMRSRTNKVLAGVCGGLGNYFNVDPVVFRLLFVFLLLPGGAPGILPYIILWVIMPEEQY